MDKFYGKEKRGKNSDFIENCTYGTDVKIPKNYIQQFVERNKDILSKRKPQSKEECRVKAEKADILTKTILSIEV